MNALDWAMLGYFVALNGTYAVFMALSSLELASARSSRLSEMHQLTMRLESTPPITVIVPAYNEAAVIVDSVRGLLALEYPRYDVVVVNDGSTDATLEVLRARFELVEVDVPVRSDVPAQAVRQVFRSRVHSKLWVIDKQNGGKADALNAGINFSRTPLVCCVDADSMLDARALVHLVEPFIYGDGRVLVTGGTVRIINGATVRDGKIRAVSISRLMIVRLQMLEYLRAFLFARLALNRLGGNLIISGAMGLFQRQTLVEVGGYQVGCIGEDMELIVRIHRHMRRLRRPYRVTFVPEPTCYTLAPESFEVLGKQRDRWQRGLADSLWRHRGMLFNPRYGVVGMVTLPIFFLFELISPVVELLGYLWMVLAVVDGRIGPHVGVLFYGVASLLSVLFSMQALVMDETTFAHYPAFGARLRILGAALLENLGYRQFVLLSRTRGLLQFVRGGKAWGDMKRRALSA